MSIMGAADEKYLLGLVSMGNEQAFRRIFDSYRDKLFSYACRITANDELAEELVMDTFLKVWMKRHDLAQIDRFDSYLYTIIRNQAFSAIKRIAHEAAIINELTLVTDTSTRCTEESVVYNNYKAIFYHAVSQLPPQQKRIYKLSRDKGLKYDEIALQLNLSKNTVKAHLKKAVSSLRTAFSNVMVYLLVFSSSFFLTGLDI